MSEEIKMTEEEIAVLEAKKVEEKKAEEKKAKEKEIAVLEAKKVEEKKAKEKAWRDKELKDTDYIVMLYDHPERLYIIITEID